MLRAKPGVATTITKMLIWGNTMSHAQSRNKEVLDQTQPGLMFFPLHGAYLTLQLTATDDEAKTRVWNLASVLEQESADLASQGHLTSFVVGFNPGLWSLWSDQQPPGRPEGDSILNTSRHFSNSFSDDHLWFFLKSDSADNCDHLRKVIAEQLGDLIGQSNCTVAKQREGGKVLDHHFNDGITSPSDPIGVVGPAVQNSDDVFAGGTWALAQRFRVNWDSYGPQSIDAKEDIIGRGENGALIPNDDERSHVRRARVFDDNQKNMTILRQALPFGSSSTGRSREEGIYFSAFAESTTTFEKILLNMAGDSSSAPADKLLSVVDGEAGGYFYVPNRVALGLSRGLTADDFQPAPFWQVRSTNGYMFYNGNDYLNVMSTGKYVPGDPPTDRILTLAASSFSRWRDNWYVLREIPKVPHLSNYVTADEKWVLNASVAIRKGMAIRKSLTEVHTNDHYPSRPDDYSSRADTFRIHPADVLFGVMPELSLARGKEVMPYLQDGDERISSYLMGVSEGGMVGHVVPDHPVVLENGLGALIRDMKKRAESASETSQQEFYQSVLYALEGVQGWCLNYASLAEKMAANVPSARPGEVKNLLELAARARRLSEHKAETFIEGVQTVFMMHCCVHLIGNPVAIGRLDQYLIDLYHNDTDVTPEQAQEAIDALWVKLDEKAIHNRHYITDHLGYGMTAVPYSGGNFPQGSALNQWVQQITVGGYTRDGQGGCNDVTLMCLKAARRLPLNAPCLSLRLYPGMPKECIDEAAKALLSGGAHPILFQDDRMVTGLNQFSHFPVEDARDYACDGCYEPMINGRTEFAFGSIAPLDALEMAINQGATIMGTGVINLRGLQQGLRTPPAEEIKSFEEIQKHMQFHLHWLTVRLFNGILANYGNIGKVSPGPLLSLMMKGCVERGRDIYSGGAQYHLISPMFVGMSTTIDSLYAIQKMVFDPNTAVATLPEILECLRSDWGYSFKEPFQSTLAGKERAEVKGRRFKELRAIALNLPKFGTGHPEVDALGAWLAETVCTIARDTMDNPPGLFKDTLQNIKDKFDVEMHMTPGIGTFEEYDAAGGNSAASADGRRWGQPYPSDFSPAPVPQDLSPIPQDVNAAQPRPDSYRDIYESMKSWDDPAIYHQITNASPVDLNIREDFSEADLVEFITRYANGDGVGSNLITVSCGDPDTYAAAETEPERYELVRVRMGGWTEFFAAMFPVHQEQHKRRPWFVTSDDS